jgi:hypothetical protein
LAAINDDRTMDNLFWNELSKLLKPYIKKAYRSKRVKGNVILGLLGHDDKIKPTKNRITAIEDYLSSLLFNYGELSESLKRFKIIAVLIRQYPKLASWDKVELSKTTYLRYHYEAFLNEAYLYRERMSLLLNNLKKQCKQKGLPKEAEFTQKVLVDFLNSLEGVTKVRGLHVHVRRYKNNKIEQLAALELVLEFAYIERIRNQEYRRLRIQLSNEVDTFAKDMEKLQNVTLNKMRKLAFTDLKKQYE